MFKIQSKSRKICKSKSQSQNIRLQKQNLHWKMICCHKPAALMNEYKDWLYRRRPDQRLDFCHSPLVISYFAPPWTWAISCLPYRGKSHLTYPLMSWWWDRLFSKLFVHNWKEYLIQQLFLPLFKICGSTGNPLSLTRENVKSYTLGGITPDMNKCWPRKQICREESGGSGKLWDGH